MSQQIKQARKLLTQGKAEDALELTESVLEDDDANIHALLMKGACLQSIHRNEEGIKTLKRVVALDSNCIAAWKGLSRFYYFTEDMSNFFEASVKALHLLSLHPANLPAEQAEADAGKLFLSLRESIYKLSRKLRKSSRASNYGSSSGAGGDSETVIEKTLELQIPSIPSTPKEYREIHEFLEGIKPSVFDHQALQELIYHRQNSLKKKLASIEARQKQTLGYTPEKALVDRIEAINNSKLTELLRIHISTENDDDTRRESESQLLEVLVSELEFLTKSKGHNAQIKDLRTEIHDLVDGMAMFEPTKPLAWELAWDWDPPSLELSGFPETKQKETKAKRKRSKKKSSDKQSNDDKNSRDDKNPKENKDKHNSSKSSKTSKETNSEESSSSSSSSSVLEDQVSELSLNDEDLGTPISRGNNNKSDQPQTLTPEMAVIRYSQLFPDTPLGKVLNAFLSPTLSYNVASKSYRAYNRDSVYGLLLCAKFFISNGAYEDSIDAVHNGLRAIKKREQTFGMDLRDATMQLKMILALSYTHFQAPKNFGLASDLYDEVLKSQPDNTDAIVGKGLVLSQQGEQKEARELLEKAIEQDPSNQLALGELSWLFVQSGEIERGIEGLKRCLSLHNTPGRNAELHFKIGYALWTTGEFERSFESFVDALASSPNYAPAYTYLGLFYEDIAKDKQRAHRCFYRALELDNGELIAGERLAADFANNSQWDLVEVVSSTVLASTKLKGMRGVDWPYRAMGIVCLNQMRYEDAVKYFQRCLRSQSSDVQAWIGLGEAYIHGGRYRSAEKALTRALKIEPENFSGHYVLSLAHREMLDFPASSKSLELAIKYAPQASAALQWALADNSLRAANFFVGESRLGEAIVELHQALKAVSSAVDSESTGILWGSAAEAVAELQEMGYKTIESVPAEVKNALLDLNSRLDLDGSQTLQSLQEKYALRYVEMSAEESKARRVSAHILAAESLRRGGSEKLEEAVKHYQAAISLEPRNESLWASYGVALQTENPQVAQHCFVRALSLNGRNADTWTSLAGLYLMNGDAELCLEAVDRALSLDPEHSHAWIAQALAETMLQSKTNEQLYRTLEYAQKLASNDELANFVFALKEFERRPETPSPASIGGLSQLLAVRPDHHDAKLIMGLLLERQGDYESSIGYLKSVSAWCHVARVQLALKDYAGSLESCAKILDGDSPSSYEQLSGLLTSGLAHFFTGDLDSSIESFTEALSVASTTSTVPEEDALRLLVEVLYASADADARQAAQDQLFASIEEHGATLQTTLLLGAIGLLEKDEAVMQAARHELAALVTPSLQGESLAQACHVLSLLDPSDNSFQRAVFQWPTDYSLWRRVSKDQALLIAEGQSTNSEQLSRALVEAPSLERCQRAVFYTPVSESAWQALAEQIQEQHTHN